MKKTILISIVLMVCLASAAFAISCAAPYESKTVSGKDYCLKGGYTTDGYNPAQNQWKSGSIIPATFQGETTCGDKGYVLDTLCKLPDGSSFYGKVKISGATVTVEGGMYNRGKMSVDGYAVCKGGKCDITDPPGKALINGVYSVSNAIGVQADTATGIISGTAGNNCQVSGLTFKKGDPFELRLGEEDGWRALHITKGNAQIFEGRGETGPVSSFKGNIQVDNGAKLTLPNGAVLEGGLAEISGDTVKFYSGKYNSANISGIDIDGDGKKDKINLPSSLLFGPNPSMLSMNVFDTYNKKFKGTLNLDFGGDGTTDMRVQTPSDAGSKEINLLSSSPHAGADCDANDRINTLGCNKENYLVVGSGYLPNGKLDGKRYMSVHGDGSTNLKIMLNKDVTGMFERISTDLFSGGPLRGDKLVVSEGSFDKTQTAAFYASKTYTLQPQVIDVKGAIQSLLPETGTGPEQGPGFSTIKKWSITTDDNFAETKHLSMNDRGEMECRTGDCPEEGATGAATHFLSFTGKAWSWMTGKVVVTELRCSFTGQTVLNNMIPRTSYLKDYMAQKEYNFENVEFLVDDPGGKLAICKLKGCEGLYYGIIVDKNGKPITETREDGVKYTYYYYQTGCPPGMRCPDGRFIRVPSSTRPSDFENILVSLKITGRQISDTELLSPYVISDAISPAWCTNEKKGPCAGTPVACNKLCSGKSDCKCTKIPEKPISP